MRKQRTLLVSIFLFQIFHLIGVMELYALSLSSFKCDFLRIFPSLIFIA